MFVKVNYFGSYPLGADVELNNVKIMQSEWNEYRKLTFIYGKKTVVNLFGLQLFYVVSQTKIVFFAAYEYHLGHYHIFAVSDSTNKKLSKSINFTSHPNLFEDEKLFDTLDLMIDHYHKIKKSERKEVSSHTLFFEIHKYVCDLEEQGKIITDNKKSIKYLKEILINDGPESALVINFESKAFANKKYKIGVCVRGEPLIEKYKLT